MPMSEAEDPISHGTGTGDLCLDFANTMDWHSSPDPKETLHGYADLLEWSRRERVLSSDDARALAAKMEGRDGLQDAVMGQAVELRESIYRLFSARAHGRDPSQEDLGVLNRYLGRGMSRALVKAEGAVFRWAWSDEDKPVDMMFWPIARSAADLLTSREVSRVKECANDEEGCGWLFVDTSKNQSRRWCSMQSCGNRAKFRRYYQAHGKEGKGGGVK